MGLESWVSLLTFTALSLLPSICCLRVAVFMWVSSGDSKLLSSNFLSRCVSICSNVHTCRYLNGPGLLIFPGVEASWHIWIVQWLLGHPLRMHLLPISRVRPKNQLTSGSLDWTLMLKLVFCRSHWLGFHVFSTELSQDSLQILLVPAAHVVERLQRITTHESVEKVYFIFFCELIVAF